MRNCNRLSKKKVPSISLQWTVEGQALGRLNEWRIPAYVSREKSVVFTERSSYDILTKHYEVKNKERNMQPERIVHSKIYKGGSRGLMDRASDL